MTLATDTGRSYPADGAGLANAAATTQALNEVSWRAVLAGVLTAVVTQLLLNMLGVGIGVAALDPAATDGSNPAASTFSIIAAVWFVASGLVASYCGGYVAGRLSGIARVSTAGWHGFLAWAGATLVVLTILGSALSGAASSAAGAVGSLAGGASNLVGGAVRTAATAAAPSLAASDPFGAIDGQLRAATAGQDPAALRDAASSAVRALVTGDAAGAEAARARAADALARAQGVTPEEARTRVAAYEAQYRQAADQAKEAARKAADVAAKAVSRAALLGFAALALGALVAFFAGRNGAVPLLVAGGPVAGGTVASGRR